MNNVSYVILACHTDKGMKSFGSKGLLEFQNKRIFDHQIEWLKEYSGLNSEIIIVSNFDTAKIQKTFHDIRVIDCDINPIQKGCIESNHDTIIFIDYGCLFNPNIFKNIKHNNNYILTVDDSKLDIGCIVDNKDIHHVYLDLPDNKFTNIFILNSKSKNEIINNQSYRRSNLLYFETMNYLIGGGHIIKNISIDKKDFLYFKHMDQKNAINKFIKKTSATV